MNLRTLEYDIKSMKKMIERRLIFLEVTLNGINSSIKSLERELRNITKENKEQSLDFVAQAKADRVQNQG